MRHGFSARARIGEKPAGGRRLLSGGLSMELTCRWEAPPAVVVAFRRPIGLHARSTALLRAGSGQIRAEAQAGTRGLGLQLLRVILPTHPAGHGPPRGAVTACRRPAAQPERSHDPTVRPGHHTIILRVLRCPARPRPAAPAAAARLWLPCAATSVPTLPTCCW